MLNQAMKRKLESGEVIDVRAVGAEVAPGVYRLNDFQEDADYCDAEREAWVWSIGRHTQSGEVFAALDARFYQNPDYECLWLR